MELEKISLSNYKSIQKCELVLSNKKMITLIGKNGAGKTNVLQAIEAAFSSGDDYRYQDSIPENFYVERTYRLTEEELQEFSSSVMLDKIGASEIKIKSVNGKPYAKHVEAPLFVQSAIDLKNKLLPLQERIKNACENYLKHLEEVETEALQKCYIDTTIGPITRLFSFQKDNIANNVKYILEKIENTINHYFVDKNTFQIERYGTSSSLFLPYDLELPSKFENPQQFCIHPFTAKALGYSAKQVEELNAKIANEISDLFSTLNNLYDEIHSACSEFQNTVEELEHLFIDAEDRKFEAEKSNKQKTQSFIQKLKQTAFQNVYYIDNENSLFFHTNGYTRQKTNPHVILEVLHEFLSRNNMYKPDESILDHKKIDPNRLKKIVSYINKKFMQNICPKFDAQTSISYQLKMEDSPQLYVKESTGNLINFNETSLGRRWYLTYKFITSSLKPGDLLLIDEPASFLHPQAQNDVRTELEELSEKGITVILATHSPHMISRNICNIVNVEMGDTGTTLRTFHENENTQLHQIIQTQLGFTPFNEILFYLNKTILLVEGYSDKLCIEIYAKSQNIDLTNYQIVVCNGSAIILLANFCIEQGIKFKALFDRDTFSKPDGWLKSQVGYKIYLENIKSNKNCIFTPKTPNGMGSIEDLFSKTDRELYFERKSYSKPAQEKTIYKLNPTKLETSTGFDNETNENFKTVFQELGIIH